MSALDLRERLVTLRADALEQLGDCDGIDGGLLALVGYAGAALDALDRVLDDAEPMVRAIVTDVPGNPVVLSLYGEEGRAATIQLSPLRSVALARQLLDAALRRLPR